jgi:hypothetical protein
MANIEKRGGYKPRRAREQRAYRMVVVGGASGIAGVVALVLAVAGTISAIWPIILLIVTALCVAGFRSSTS